ncbi:hypothetical protein BLOT_014286 [Blomia tropicalis]|nr:hypothetical protein BLOT_014286 [Blomia tropicalis]
MIVFIIINSHRTICKHQNFSTISVIGTTMVKERIFTIMTNEDKQVYELKYEKLDIKRFQLLLNGAKVSKWPDRFTYDKKYDKEFLTKPIIQSFMVQSPVGLGPIIFLATSSGSRLYFEAAKKSTVSKIQKPFPLTQTIISLNDRLQNLFIIDHNNGSCMKLSFKFVEFSMFPLPGNIVQVKNSTKPLLMCSHGDQKISFTNGTKCQKNGKTFNWKLNIGFTDSSYFYLFGTNIVYIFKYELYDNLDTIGPFYVRTFEDFFWNTKKVPPITEHPGDPTDPYNPYNPSNNETNGTKIDIVLLLVITVIGILTKVSKVETSKTTKKSKISKTRKKHKKLGTKSALSSIKRKGSSKSRLSAQSSPNRSSKVTTRASKILPKSLDLVSQSMLKSIQTENIMNSKRTKHNSPSFRTGKDTPRRSIKVAGMNSKRTSILIKQAVQSGVKDKSTKIKSSKVSKKMNQSHKQSLSTNPNSSIKKKAAMKSKKGSVNQKSYSKKSKKTSANPPSYSKKSKKAGINPPSYSKKSKKAGGNMPSYSKKSKKAGGNMPNYSKKSKKTGGNAPSYSKKGKFPNSKLQKSKKTKKISDRSKKISKKLSNKMSTNTSVKDSGLS